MKTRSNIKKIMMVIMTMIIVILGTGCNILDGTMPQNKAEANAVKFLEYKYDGNAQKCIDLLLDELVAEAIVAYGYETEDVLVYALDKQLDNSIEIYQEEYGKKWKYEISIIDSYEITAPEGFSEYECMEVLLNVQFEGRKLLFFKVDGSEEIKVQMIKKNNTWYVLGASFALI